MCHWCGIPTKNSSIDFVLGPGGFGFHAVGFHEPWVRVVGLDLVIGRRRHPDGTLEISSRIMARSNSPSAVGRNPGSDDRPSGQLAVAVGTRTERGQCGDRRDRGRCRRRHTDGTLSACVGTGVKILKKLKVVMESTAIG